MDYELMFICIVMSEAVLKKLIFTANCIQIWLQSVTKYVDSTKL